MTIENSRFIPSDDYEQVATSRESAVKEITETIRQSDAAIIFTLTEDGIKTQALGDEVKVLAAFAMIYDHLPGLAKELQAAGLEHRANVAATEIIDKLMKG